MVSIHTSEYVTILTIHDNTEMRERKKERKTPEANEK